MAIEIEALYLRSMTNGAIYEFFTATINRGKACEGVSTKASAQLLTLENKQKAFDNVLKLSQKSEQTDKIEEYDRIRDCSYSAYRQAVKTFADIYTGEQQEAALRLQQHIIDYRIDTKDELRKQTGEMTNFNADLAGKYAADVAALALTKVVETMTEANNQVSALMQERDDANASRVVGATKAAREACEKAYRNLVKKVNALSLVDNTYDYTAFIDGMNEQIEQYRKRVLTKRRSKKEE